MHDMSWLAAVTERTAVMLLAWMLRTRSKMTKKIAVRLWKTLQRHELSAQYENIAPRVFADMVADLKEVGVVDGRTVTVVDVDGQWQIIDGFQFYQACLQANVKPEFAPVPKGVPLEKYVAIKNDHRRHETAEQAKARVDARRERVAAAKEAGKSTRAIAEEEGVGQATIDRKSVV